MCVSFEIISHSYPGNFMNDDNDDDENSLRFESKNDCLFVCEAVCVNPNFIRI